MTRLKLSLIALVLAALIAPFSASAQASTQIHNQVRESLVQLTASGTARIGPSTGGIVEAVGTGFFVGSDGYILTTAHLFDTLKEANASGAKISGTIVGDKELKVLYVSELSSLDLVLLRAIVPFGIETPPSLEIGHSSEIDPDEDDVEFLTSGYDKTGYRKKRLDFNDRSNAIANFAWTMDGKTNSGQSGSPVYVGKEGKPVVVGVLKATSRVDDELSLMIPIENSFQLIGQFKMQELQQRIDALQGMRTRVEQLEKLLGEIPAEKPPLGDRIGSVESSVEEIQSNFTWSADVNKGDGSIVIQYEKLIGRGPQINEISVKILPYIFKKDDETNEKKIEPSITMKLGTIKRSELDPSARRGEFEITEMQDELTLLAKFEAGRGNDPYDEPFRDLEINLTAEIPGIPGGEITETITFVPRFDWDFGK